MLTLNNLDFQYTDILQKIYRYGIWSNNRTGIRSKTIPAAMIQHNMSDGFPLLTIKKVPFKTMAVELEGFIKGISSKKWYQERKCHIWDEWCNPKKIPYSNDVDKQKLMKEEDDLGIIYGNNWRDFNDAGNEDYPKNSIDQLSQIVQTLKTKPNDRRMICLAWNPLALDYAALPACHVLWQVSVLDNKINLTWFQRSCDHALGIPFNIASYGLLLHLLAKETGLGEGVLTGFLNNVHYYENQADGVEEILARHNTYQQPTISTPKFTNIFEWEYSDSKIENYKHSGVVSMPIAI